MQARRRILPSARGFLLLALILGLSISSFAAQATNKTAVSNRPESQKAYEAGMRLVRTGRLDDAIRVFQHGLQADAENLNLLDAIGATLSLQGNFGPAQQYFERSLQLNPQFEPARKNLAINYYNLGQYDLAASEFETLAKFPGEPRSVANLFLGILADKNHNYSNSAALLEKSGVLLDKYPDALIAFADSLIQLKQAAKAAVVLNRVDAIRGVSGDQYVQAGVLYLQLGQEKRALGEFDRAAQKGSTGAALEYQRAVALDKLGRSQEAEQILKNLTIASPDPDSLNLLAHIAEKNQEFELALRSLKQAAKLAPDREDNYLDFSTFCADYENFPLALEAAEIGLEHIPNSYRLTVQKGAVLEKLARLDEAEEVLKKASTLQDDNEVALLSLAIVQSHAEKLQDSVDTLTAAIQKYPDNFYMHYHLGVVLMQIEQRDAANEATSSEAERAFRVAIKLNPSFSDSYYQLSKVYLSKSPKLAEENLVACLRVDPNHVGAEYTLGRLYMKSGRKAEGQALIDKFESQQEAEKVKEQSRPRIRAAQR
jgi:tetratricopeptide (TPR) repeat protein